MDFYSANKNTRNDSQKAIFSLGNIFQLKIYIRYEIKQFGIKCWTGPRSNLT